MKKLLIAIIIISSLFSQSLTKGWYNDDFEVPDKLTTDDLEVLGGVPGVGKVLTDDGAGTGIAVWAAPAGGGANTALSNLAAVAINQPLLLGASDGGALGSATKMWSDLFLASGGVINFNAGDLTLTHSANLLTLGGGDLQLGANNLGLTGSFGLTASRILKGWFTDLECTNSITIGGTALSALYQPLDGALTNLSGLAYVSPSFIKMTANDTYAVRTLAETKTDLSLNNVDNVADASQVSTGALNSGSITNGFGAIDIGASAYTTTGQVNSGTGVFSSTITTNGNYVSEGYSTGRNVERITFLKIYAGTTPGTNVSVQNITANAQSWNNPSITNGADMTSGGGAVGSFSFTNTELTMNLTEVVIFGGITSVVISDVENSDATAVYGYKTKVTSGNLIIIPYKNGGNDTASNWVNVLTHLGDAVYLKILYKTST